MIKKYKLAPNPFYTEKQEGLHGSFLSVSGMPPPSLILVEEKHSESKKGRSRDEKDKDETRKPNGGVS